MHVPPSSIYARPHLIWFFPTSGHLIAPTLQSITEFGAVFKTHVYQNRTRDIKELKQHLVDVWSDFGQTVIDGAVDEWRKRLQACVRMKGHHLEHVLLIFPFSVDIFTVKSSGSVDFFLRIANVYRCYGNWEASTRRWQWLFWCYANFIVWITEISCTEI